MLGLSARHPLGDSFQFCSLQVRNFLHHSPTSSRLEKKLITLFLYYFVALIAHIMGITSFKALLLLTIPLFPGVVSGVLLMVSSVLNAGNLLPSVSVFVYETVMTALPLSLVITILLMLLRYPLVSDGYVGITLLLDLTVV